MKRLTRFQENISVKKATNYAIIINSLEILLILGVMTLVVISPQYDFSPRMVRLLVGVAAAVIIWGAVMDIREAMSTRRLLCQLDAMDDTIDAMEKLNNTLRAQRHDFLNHLQVVYSLMEMEEYSEANSYIEKVYGRITAVSRVLKTASAPINALLQVKLAACEKAGVQVTLNITSTWKELPISGWEMCKVLSNLIDNAIDAMADLPNGKKHLTITLTENLKEYVFSVANTGTPIPPDDQQRIFEPGVTTKSTVMAWGCSSSGRRCGTTAATFRSQATRRKRCSPALCRRTRQFRKQKRHKRTAQTHNQPPLINRIGEGASLARASRNVEHCVQPCA